MTKLKTYFLETRPPFLILSIVLSLLGTAIAWYHQSFHLGHALLCALGLLLLHISTNVLNDYFDFKSGIDKNTKPTPFSGGSGMIINGALSAKQVLWFGMIAFILAVPIGCYFMIVRGSSLLLLFGIGGLFVLAGSSHFTKIGFSIGELVAGLGLGSLPVFGIVYILHGDFSSSIIFASVPSGILVFNLLFLNEFPDIEADTRGGRKTLASQLGLSKSAILYSVLTSLVYIWVIAGVILDWMPLSCLIALLTLPIAIKAMRSSFKYSDMQQLVPGLGANVGTVLATQFLMAVGFILGRVFGL